MVTYQDCFYCYYWCPTQSFYILHIFEEKGNIHPLVALHLLIYPHTKINDSSYGVMPRHLIYKAPCTNNSVIKMLYYNNKQALFL